MENEVQILTPSPGQLPKEMIVQMSVEGWVKPSQLEGKRKGHTCRQVATGTGPRRMGKDDSFREAQV